ncbi:MAG: PA4642 family protein [Alcanivoracaceae bacterium]|nr:PA4642 family protein [Alcanivoracaceae bacterium]
MSERKDKKKVVGEPMTDEQIKFFQEGHPETGEDQDFHDLLRAYRSLREEDFERFLTFFCEQGRNVNAKGLDGQTLLEISRTHRKSTGYVEALEKAGAQ